MSAVFHPGHLVMVDIPGISLDATTAEFIRRHHVRAVCLFRRNLGTAAEVRRLTTDLRELMGPHALIGIDQEGGSVVRATFLPQAPAAMALGAVGDESLCEEVGAAVARGLRSLGINWNFAPVLDVNNNPANPVIAERSFGEDPDAVRAPRRRVDARLAGRGRRLLREALPRPRRHARRLAPRAADGRQVARTARGARAPAVPCARARCRHRARDDDRAHRLSADRPRASGDAVAPDLDGAAARVHRLRRRRDHRRPFS